MKKTILILIPIIIVLYIIYSSSQTKSNQEDLQPIKIQSLIAKNDDKKLFLSFWEGIDESEFELVRELETKNGNLKKGDFILMLPEGNSSFKEVPFSLNRKDKSIVLRYNDHHWVNRKDIDILETEDFVWGRQAETKGRFYEQIENYLTNTFDEKYERVEPDSKIWKTKINNGNYKSIMLNVNYWYYENNAKTREPYGEHIFENGGKLLFEPDDRKKRDKVASCKIEIVYELFDTYLNRVEIQKRNAEQYKQEKIQQENETKNKIDENKSKL